VWLAFRATHNVDKECRDTTTEGPVVNLCREMSAAHNVPPTAVHITRTAEVPVIVPSITLSSSSLSTASSSQWPSSQSDPRAQIFSRKRRAVGGFQTAVLVVNNLKHHRVDQKGVNKRSLIHMASLPCIAPFWAFHRRYNIPRHYGLCITVASGDTELHKTDRIVLFQCRRCSPSEDVPHSQMEFPAIQSHY
jgi:hypothetical protein